MTALFLAWYFLYVLLAAYAPDFMSQKVYKEINVGLLFGFGQFISTFVITILYVRWADREFDPRAEALAQMTDSKEGHDRERFVVPLPATDVGNPALNITIFAIFVVVTLVIVIRVSRATTRRADSTTPEVAPSPAARTASPSRVTTSRPRASSASPAPSPCNGYDGFLYSIGFLVAWLVALLLVAELLRNTGRFTMADVLSYRLRQRPVRIATAISALTVSFFYLLAQMAGAGGLVSLLLGIEGEMAAEPRHRARRRHHDHLRPHRRDEGDHLGADHQGAAPHRRHRGHHADGARQVQLQPLRALPERRGQLARR